jgi:hypothetical protein
MSTESDERPGHPSTCINYISVAKCNDLVQNDGRLAIYKMAEEVGISFGSLSGQYD